MEIEKWIAKTETLSDWLDGNPPADEDAEDNYDILRLMIRRGNKNHDKIDKCWNAIRFVLRDVEGHPLPSGRESTLPPHVQQNLREIATDLTNDYAEAFSNSEMIGLTHFRRVKGVVDIYEDGNAFATHKAKTVIANLTGYFKSGFWDGTIDGLQNIEVVQNED